MNDKLRNHGLPVPKEAETAEPMSAEERAQKLTRICLGYWGLDDPEFEDNYALDIAEQIRQAEQAAYERAAQLVALQNGPGRGEWIVPLVAEIRALAQQPEEVE